MQKTAQMLGHLHPCETQKKLLDFGQAQLWLWWPLERWIMVVWKSSLFLSLSLSICLSFSLLCVYWCCESERVRGRKYHNYKDFGYTECQWDLSNLLVFFSSFHSRKWDQFYMKFFDPSNMILFRAGFLLFFFFFFFLPPPALIRGTYLTGLSLLKSNGLSQALRLSNICKFSQMSPRGRCCSQLRTTNLIYLVLTVEDLQFRHLLSRKTDQ